MTESKNEYPIYQDSSKGNPENVGKIHKSHFGEYFLLRFKGVMRPLYLVPASEDATKFRIFKNRHILNEKENFTNVKGQAVLPFRGATYLRANLFGFKDCLKISLIPAKRNYV